LKTILPEVIVKDAVQDAQRLGLAWLKN
jgi:hypothetical protein